MFISNSNTGGEDPKKARQMMASMMGPGHVDHLIRMAVQHCWTMLPDEQRNAAELERQCRRILDRALADFQEDLKAFKVDPPPV